jgi:general secretion pathway protein G
MNESTCVSVAERRRRASGGFSILELLLVLVILSILAGIVGVRFVGQSGKAKVRAAETQLVNFESALQAYEIGNGQFPTTQQGLDALYEAPAGVDSWDGPYLTKRVEADPWGKPWQYRSPGTRNKDYDLYSFGPDGQERGGDDIVNWSVDQ